MFGKRFARRRPPPALPRRPFRFGVNFSAVMSRAELIDTAQKVEALGYDVFAVSDHLHPEFAQLAPLPTLATVAQHTRNIALQTLVLANDFRHPVMLANDAATLQELSGGRFQLGIGAGWFAPDYTASGIPFYRAPQRVARVAETVEVLRGLQTGEPFTFAGEHYSVSELAGIAVSCAKPVPLLVGGSGPVLLSLAARRADTVGLNPGFPMSYGRWQKGATPYADATDTKMGWVLEAAGERARSLEVQSSVFAGGITEADPSTLFEPIVTAMGVTASQLEGCPHFLAGPLEHCVDAVRTWRERWGISYITFPHTLAESMAPLVAQLRGQ